MNQKQIIYYTAYCLALDLKPKNKNSISEDFKTGKTELDDFIYFCSNQLILPAVYLKLNRHEILSTFPDEYKFHIAALYLQNKKRNLDILNQVEEINKVLATENIEPVYLKGTANLLDNVYSDIGERMIGDIDLLVRDKDYLKAAKLVQKLGYKTDERIYSDVHSAKHYPRLYKEDVVADIEIHRLPVNKEYTKAFTTELLFGNKKKIEDKENCFVPSDEHKLILNFIHHRLSNLGHRFKQISFRDIYDFYLLFVRQNSTEVINRVEHKKAYKNYLYLSEYLFNTNHKTATNNKLAEAKYLKSVLWFTEHPVAHKYYILFQKTIEILFIRMYHFFVQFISDKNIRKGFFERVISKETYQGISFRIRNFKGNFLD